MVKYIDIAVPLTVSNQKERGINSRINAQLTLKYRLARILKRRQEGEPVEETREEWGTYKKYATDSAERARRWIKKNGPNFVDDFLQKGNEFWFVALTNDNSRADPFCDVKLRPLVLDSGGQDIWDSVKGQFGLITYNQLDKLLSKEGPYASARKYFLPKFYIKPSTKALKLRTENWDTFSKNISDDIRAGMQKIVESAIDSLYGPGSGQKARVEYNGSDSYLLGQRTLIKLVPQRIPEGERMLLAVLCDMAQAAGVAEQFFPEGPFLIGIGGREREFAARAFTACPTAQDDSHYTEIIMTVLQTADEQ